MLMLILGAIVSIGLVLGTIWLINFLRFWDVREATAVTKTWWKSALMGVASMGVMLSMGLVDVLLAIVSDPFGPILAIWGYISVKGLISIQPETWALVTIVIVAIGLYWKDVRPRRG